MTLETCDQSDKETWPDKQKDNADDKDKDKYKDNDNDNDKDILRTPPKSNPWDFTLYKDKYKDKDKDKYKDKDRQSSRKNGLMYTGCKFPMVIH